MQSRLNVQEMSVSELQLRVSSLTWLPSLLPASDAGLLHLCQLLARQVAGAQLRVHLLHSGSLCGLRVVVAHSLEGSGEAT